ncbi:MULTISPECIES: hypothetical protein [unclassified Phenylobacterium]|nr:MULTISPECIES: hypothetical protein [unclassified Phenylobacterium]
MRCFELLRRLGGLNPGDAKRLTRGYPDGEFIELAGDRYDEV